MDSSEFSILVGKLERELDLSPRLHYARIGCIAALGYLPLAILGLTALGALGYALVAFFSAHVVAVAPIVAFVCSMAALAGIVAVLGAPVYVEEGRDLRYDEAPALCRSRQTGRFSARHSSSHHLSTACEFSLNNASAERSGE